MNVTVVSTCRDHRQRKVYSSLESRDRFGFHYWRSVPQLFQAKSWTSSNMDMDGLSDTDESLWSACLVLAIEVSFVFFLVFLMYVLQALFALLKPNVKLKKLNTGAIGRTKSQFLPKQFVRACLVHSGIVNGMRFFFNFYLVSDICFTNNKDIIILQDTSFKVVCRFYKRILFLNKIKMKIRLELTFDLRILLSIRS